MLEAIEQLNTMVESSVFIVTTSSGNERGGSLISFATQGSIDPVTYLLLVAHSTHTYGLIEESRACTLHWVEHGQDELVRHFAEKTGFSEDKFEGIECHVGLTGSPTIDLLPGYVELELPRDLLCGDHTAYLGYPLEAEIRRAFTPYALRDIYNANIKPHR